MLNPFEIKTNYNKQKYSRKLDWEESAVDSSSTIDDIHDSDRVIPNFVWMKFALVLVFGILTWRIFYLQIIKGDSFRAFSDNNRVRSQSLLAPRGLILDRNGQILAQNTASFNLIAVPFDLPKNEQELNSELQKASELFAFNLEDLKSKIKKSSSNSLLPIVILQDISQEQAILFETKASEFIGISVQRIPVRDYVDAEVFSHVLGYTGLVSQQDLKNIDQKKYDHVDFTGKTGIELKYEKFVHGVNGQDLVEVDATGKLLNTLGKNEPISGNTLILNIDKGLQDKLYNSLKKGKDSRAAAVAMNPRNGQILALVSLPGFNNNLFARGIKSEVYNTMLNDKDLPLFNRTISGTYPPGSTVKPMVSIAGLEEDIIDENTIINDTGKIVIPNQFDPSLNYEFRGWKLTGLGKMNVRSAIAMSSDIFFYEVAGGSPNGTITGLGIERLANYYRKFKLGSLSGIDIPGEKPGLVPDPDWKMKYYKNDPLQGKWYLGDTYHVGIGQGDLLVTPLQVTLWTAAIANNGVGFVPQIANRAVDASGKIVWQSEPQVLISDIASQENIKIAQEGMRETVLNGTAKALSALSITAAGKTGTSQFDGSNLKRTHAWFTSYAPYEDPQIVITVLVEAGGEGNAVAEPVAREALEWWAKNRLGK